MRSYIFSQDRTRERKFVQLPLSLYVLVHLCDTFDIVSHFFDYFWRGDNTNTLSQTTEPSIELRADLNVGVNGKVLFIVGIHHNVLTETVYHHIRQAVGEPYFYLLDFAGEHSEHSQGTLCQFEFFERILALPLLAYYVNLVHFIHTEMLHLPALVCQKVVVVITP